MSNGIDTENTENPPEIDPALCESELLDVTDPAVGIYEHLPLFDMYLGNLSSRVAVSLSDYIRNSVALVANAPTIGKFDPIANEEDQPKFSRLYRFPSLNGMIGVIVPKELVFRLVDILFGGSGELEEKNLTEQLSGAEQSMVDKVADETIDAVKELLQATTSIENSIFIEPWSHQQAARVGRPESMVRIEFAVAVGSFDTTMELWFSLSVLELLLGAKLLPAKDGSVNEPAWSAAFKDQISDCQLELKCKLADQSMPLRQVRGLKTGDFIPLSDVSEAIFSIESLPLFKAKVGVTNDRVSASFYGWI